MGKHLKTFGFVLTYTAVFVIVTFLMGLGFGDKPEDYDIKEEALTGLVASVIILLLKYYEKKKLK